MSVQGGRLKDKANVRITYSEEIAWSTCQFACSRLSRNGTSLKECIVHMTSHSHEDAVFARTVAVSQQAPAEYPSKPPFHPAEKYPETPFMRTQEERNPAYGGVREALRMLGMDVANYGKATWNPLGLVVKPGDTVLVKPNLICEGHATRKDEWVQVVTHGAVVRAVLDYVYIALGGKGRVIIADGPQTDSDFETICERVGLLDVGAFYKERGLALDVVDLRRDRWHQKDGVIFERTELTGDPAGYTTVDLGEASEFKKYRLSGRFYGADYDTRETRAFHSNGRHTYILCRTAMTADVLINVPKLKTHKKTGVTICLKNMVGINGYRNCLPHYTLGTPKEGGDEFSEGSLKNRLQSGLVSAFKKVLTISGGKGGVWARVMTDIGRLLFGDTNAVVRSGNWHGNDTAWRMVLDLNKVLFHFDGLGKTRQRRLPYVTVVDGIIAGEGNGPVSPEAREAGLVVAGLNPVAVDTVCATLMGFDYRKIPNIEKAWEAKTYPIVDFRPEDICCVSNVEEWNGTLRHVESAPHLGFEAHFGWRGHIEREQMTNHGNIIL